MSFSDLSRGEITNLIISLAIIPIAVVLGWISSYLLSFVAKRLIKKTETRLDDVIIATIKTPIRIIIVLTGIDFALSNLYFVDVEWLGRLNDAFFILYMTVAIVTAYRLVGALTGWYGEEVVYVTDTDLDDKFLSFFSAIANIIIISIAIVILLGHFGIEPSALVATLGIGTLAVALAAQEALSDMIAGFMIMLDRPFAIGDRIEIQDIDTWGDVTDIGLRSTRILTRDNRMVAVPNSVIGKGLVVNYSDPSTVYRVQTHVGVAYGTDLERARNLMIDAIMAEEWVMKERPVEALMLEFADSALIFRVRCWIEHYVETRRVIDKMNTALYKALRAAEIEIPFPHRVVRLYKDGYVSEDQKA